MASHVAISPDKQKHYMEKRALDKLQRLHKVQKVEGWQYGTAAQADELLGKVVTVKDVVSLKDENAALKAKLAALEASQNGSAAPEVKIEEPVNDSKKNKK